ITALTAQNTQGVTGTLAVPTSFVMQQLDAIFSDFRIDAAKTGMLGSSAIVEAIAERIQSTGLKRFVVDPVVVSSSGTSLLDASALDVFKNRLLPLATLATPNIQEAGILAEMDIQDSDGMEVAARRIHEMGVPFVLVKGGHLCEDAVDVLFDG